MIDTNKIKENFSKKLTVLNDKEKSIVIDKWNNTIDTLINIYKNIENSEFQVLDDKSYKLRLKEFEDMKSEGNNIDFGSLGFGLNQIDIGVIIEMLQKIFFEKKAYFDNELIRNNYKYIYNQKLIKYSKEISKDLEKLKWP